MYNEKILIAPLRLLGVGNYLDIATIYHLYNAWGVFILILLIYFFVWQLSGDKLLAAAAAVFAIGGYHIIYNKALFYNDFNIYGRAMFPYVSSLAFFTYLNLLVKYLKTKKIFYTVLTGAGLGALFYVYFFAWSFALALNGALAIFYAVKKDYQRVKNIFIATALGVLIGSYYLIQMSLFFSSAVGKQSSYFHLASSSHTPIFSKIGVITFVLWCIFAYKKKDNPHLIFILGLISAGWVSLNQQIITGRALQVGHYYWYFIVPISVIVSLYMLGELIKRERWKKIIFIFIILLVFFHGGVGQYRSFLTTVSAKLYEQNYRPLINAVKTGARPGVILAADDELAYLFTIYTESNLFWHTAAAITDIPFERFPDSLLVYLYLNKDARGDFSGYISKIMADDSVGSFYKEDYKNIEGYLSGFDYYEYNKKLAAGDGVIKEIREKTLQLLNNRYAAVNSYEGGITGLLKKYGVNYIVWDKNNHPEWDLSFIDNKEEMAKSNNIILYKIK